MVDLARKIAKENIEAIKATGAKRVVVSDAEAYRVMKVDYPKLLNIATADLGFEVVHILEILLRQSKTVLSYLRLLLTREWLITMHPPFPDCATTGHLIRVKEAGWV